MQYFRLNCCNNSFLHTLADPASVIVEVKYSRASDDKFESVSNAFPFRLTKSSKFIDGMDVVHV